MPGEKIIQIKMRIEQEHGMGKSTGTYEVIKLGKKRYQLVNNDPFYEMFSYGTEIEAWPDKNPDGVLKFKHVVKESDFSLQVIHLPAQLNEAELRSIGDMTVA